MIRNEIFFCYRPHFLLLLGGGGGGGEEEEEYLVHPPLAILARMNRSKRWIMVKMPGRLR